MKKRTRNTECVTALEAAKLCTRRDSDNSDLELLESESSISEVDFVAEAMFCDGIDSVLDRPTLEDDQEPGPSSSKRPQSGKRGRRGKGRGRVDRQPLISPAEGKWNGTEVPDITPPHFHFCPNRTPGSQLVNTSDYTVLQFFQQYFTATVLSTLVRNTNVHGRANYATWTDITLEDIFCFLALVIYMGLVKTTAVTDYWRKGSLYCFPLPETILTDEKFLSILHALHLSSPEDEGKRGTAEFDHLGKIKPLYTDLRSACRKNYQPGQNISIDKRMLPSNARIMFRRDLESKPVKWGYALFVLADSVSGYTWDFFVYDIKSAEASKKGLSYDSVMSLLNTPLLGTGYKLYVENFYTSPILFRDLVQKKVSACGTIRTDRQGYPRTTENALDSRAPCGTVKWIREDPLLFVQWKDTRDVFMCSTMHTAHGHERVQRRVKDNAGRWTVKNVPIPPVIKDYEHMGGVDLSDELIVYYEILYKTRKWYKTVFYHFMEISIVNSFILYEEHCKAKRIRPMHQKAFRETLIMELAAVGFSCTEEGTEEEEPHHHLVHIKSEGGKTESRLKCRLCHAMTAVKCRTCNIPLCFQQQRDCYSEWHQRT